MLKDVMRSRHSFQNPAFAFEAAPDVTAVREHERSSIGVDKGCSTHDVYSAVLFAMPKQ
jgi:hypothetical protein